MVLSQVLQRCVHIPVSLNCKLLVWSMVCRIMGAPPEDVHSLIPLGLHHLAEGNEGRSSPHQNRDIILHYPGGPSVIEWVLNKETGRQKRKVRGSCDCGRRSAWGGVRGIWLTIASFQHGGRKQQAKEYGQGKILERFLVSTKVSPLGLPERNTALLIYWI